MTAKHHHDHDHTHSEGRSPEEMSRAPKFDAGMHVVFRDATPERYKRRPDYAEGVEGVVERLHGAYVPPQDQEEGEPEREYLYSVRFSHTDIWGGDHPEANGTLYLDIWEAALAQAENQPTTKTA